MKGNLQFLFYRFSTERLLNSRAGLFARCWAERKPSLIWPIGRICALHLCKGGNDFARIPAMMGESTCPSFGRAGVVAAYRERRTPRWCREKGTSHPTRGWPRSSTFIHARREEYRDRDLWRALALQQAGSRPESIPDRTRAIRKGPSVTPPPAKQGGRKSCLGRWGSWNFVLWRLPLQALDCSSEAGGF